MGSRKFKLEPEWKEHGAAGTSRFLLLARPALGSEDVLLAKDVHGSVVRSIQDVQKGEWKGVVAGEFGVMSIYASNVSHYRFE